MPVDSLAALQAGLFLLLLLAASVCDLCCREIPDSLQLLIAATTLLYFSSQNLLGILGALPYLVIALLFSGMDGMGGGDIKLVAATGIVLGQGSSQNFWNTGNEGVRVTVVRVSDHAVVTTPIDLTNKSISAGIYHFGRVCKLQYSGGVTVAHP